MARPEKNTVDYYPHLLGDGKKMFFIETKYGNDGYATWHKLLEKLCDTDYHYLNLNTEEEVMYLSAKCKVSEEKLFNIINDLVKLGKFDKEMWTHKIIWCQDLVESIDDAYKKRNNNCITLKGLRLLLVDLGVLKHSNGVKNDTNNTQSRVEYTKEEESKGECENAPANFDFVFYFFKEKKISGWDEVKCSDEAQAFIDHYSRTGWKIKGDLITDWKSVANGWIRADSRFSKGNKSSPATKRFPDDYSATFAASLEGDERKKYFAHVESKGWYFTGDRDKRGNSIWKKRELINS